MKPIHCKGLLVFTREKPTPVRGENCPITNSQLPIAWDLFPQHPLHPLHPLQNPLPNCLLLFDGMSFVESFEALPVAHKPPVPRLVTDTLAVIFGEGHFKAESGGIGF